MKSIRIKLHQLINYNQSENIHSILAKYLLDNHDNINRLSINKVVEDTLISKTSILKFCRYLGYDSWRYFCSDFQEEYLDEKIRLDRLRMNAKLLFSKDNLDDYDRLNIEYFNKVQDEISFQNIKIFAKKIKDAKDIVVIGDSRELLFFYELQDLLSHYHKKLIFPKSLNKEDFRKQLSAINEDTLLIITNGIQSFEVFVEKEMIAPVYGLDEIIKTNCQIVFVGQKSLQEHDQVTTISIPFSFNEYFIRLAIIDLVYKTVTYYSHKYY